MRIRRLVIVYVALLATFGLLPTRAFITGALAGEVDCPPVAVAPTQAQIETAVRTARDRGALWTIEKDGRQSWLYGTVHVGTLDTAFPGRRVVQALRAADAIAIEIDVTDQAT